MLIRLLATAALVGLHVQHTEAHSWVGCTDYRGDINYYDNDQCKGFPRNWAGARGGSTAKQPKGYELAADTGYNVIGKCQQPLNLAQYGGAFPMAQYEQDSVYCLAWPLKNHAAATCTNQYIPDTETSVWLWPQGTRDAPTQADIDNWRAQGRELNNNFGYHKNGEIDCLGFQRTPKFCDSTGQAMATGCFHIPADAPLGVRSFMWYWAFNSQGDDFITCFEAEIKPKGSLNNGRQLERGAPWLPDNLNSGDNLGAGGNTCKNNWATRVGARFQKFSEWKAGVSAGVIVQQGAGGQPQTPVTNPPPPVITPPPNMPPPVVIPPPTNGGGNNNPPTNPSCAPGTADKVPTQIPTSGTFNIDVSYNTPNGGFLSVNILSGGGGNFGFAYLSVEPGTGTKTLMVTVFGRLVSGGDYQLLLSVRTYDMSIDQQGFSNIRVPVKAGANVVYGTIQTTPVVTPGQPPAGGGGNNGGGNIPQTPPAAVDYIDENASTFPGTIAASGTQTVQVKYGAKVNSVIVVDILQKDTYLWFGKGTARVTPGEGTASITINIQNNPTPGNNYMYNVFLVESGSFDADEGNAWQKASVGPKGITVTVTAGNGGGNNGGNQPPPVVTPPNNPPPNNPPPPVVTPNLPAGKYDYAKTASNSILFYEAQRTGKLINNRIPWRGDSALNDKGVNGEDLSGGYFDAGDHVKFNFPMAYSVTTLAWGILQNKNAYVKLGELKNAMDGVKWGADYLLKCHPDVNGHRLYAQVGDGDLDHAFWGRPEEMTMPRPVTYIDDTKPGSDLAGETAAAFAATALVFQETDPAYAATLIAHARTLFDFADTVRGKYSDSIKGQAAPAPFYVSNDFKDELVWASIWLFKATGDAKYLDYTKAKYMEFMIQYQTFSYSWDSKGPGVSMLVAQALKNNRDDPVYKAAIASVATFVKDYSAGGTVPRTPAGYPIRLMWGSNRFASAAAWIAMVYADSGLAGADAIPAQTMASSIINYIHGDNPNKRSYVVGQGNNPPTRYHHRAASCPNRPAPCGQAQFNAGTGNPQTLFGALVGGPKDTNDNSYQDQRDDYITNEVTLDYNAAFQNVVFRMAAANIGLQSASDLENAGVLEGQDTPVSKSSTSTIPIIIGASVGGVVLLLLVVGLAIYKKHHTSSSVTTARVGKETHV